MSPSIDILVSSNLERLLYLKSKDSALVSDLMSSLKKDGIFRIDRKLSESIGEDFLAFFCDEEESGKTIREYYDRYHYLIDTHTATAAAVAAKYESGYKKVILATASPFKFAKDVYRCISGENIDDGLEAMSVLSSFTGLEIPEDLAVLKDKVVRFSKVLEKDDKDSIIKELEADNA